MGVRITRDLVSSGVQPLKFVAVSMYTSAAWRMARYSCSVMQRKRIRSKSRHSSKTSACKRRLRRPSGFHRKSSVSSEFMEITFIFPIPSFPNQTFQKIILHTVVAEELSCAAFVNQQKRGMSQSLHSVNVQKIADAAALEAAGFWRRGGRLARGRIGAISPEARPKG